MQVQAMQAFWASQVASATAHEVRERHFMDGQLDKKSRFSSRKTVLNDGVQSNLYPISVNPDTKLFKYTLDVSCQPRVRERKDGKIPPPPPVAPVSLQVPPTRAWRMYAQSLRRHPSLPPLVRVASTVYSAAQLPPEVLTLPKEYHDLGWEHCRLNYEGSENIDRLPTEELKSVLNKMLPWALSFHARRNGAFAVVREVDAKMVCTDDGISVAGLRIFRGTTAAILQVNGVGAMDPKSTEKTTGVMDLRQTLGESKVSSQGVPEASTLKTIQIPGDVGQPITVRCTNIVKTFQFKGKPVSAFMCRDASGSMQITLWGCDQTVMEPGKNYVLEGLRARKCDPRYPSGDFGMELDGSVQPVGGSATVRSLEASPASNETEVATNNLHTDEEARVISSVGAKDLALRLDTRCTVASEKSLWEEVKQHFGEPPYNEDTQSRISRAVRGTPVVLSINLRHTIVRGVRFDFTSPEDAPLDPHVRQLVMTKIDRAQPYAVVHDFSVVPMQVLHCCFDPKMRSWQEVTVPVCSFLPARRIEVLRKFRSALGDGLLQWGVTLRDVSLGSKLMSLLNAPEKSREAAVAAMNGQKKTPQRIKQPDGFLHTGQVQTANRPRTHLFISICGPRASAEDRDQCNKTAETLAASFKSSYFIHVNKETDAVAYTEKVLMPEGTLRDKDACAVLIMPERDTRASRWLEAECLKRGVMPHLIRGVSGDRKLKHLVDHTKTNIQAKFTTDLVRGYNIGKEVPTLAGRSALVVGVDACHTHDITTGSCVGLLLSTQHGNRLISQFWRNDIRGKEVEQVAQHFGLVCEAGVRHNGGKPVDEVVVFQDGNVFSELESMKERIVGPSGLSFLCLHKRTHIRFTHEHAKPTDTGTKGGRSLAAGAHANVVKGAVVHNLTPMLRDNETDDVPSFYLQAHDCFVSTARTVQYKVYNQSPSLPIPDVQKLSYTLAHIGSALSTKLPLPTRCAHRLSATAERLFDANPKFRSTQIPEPLSTRAWYL